MAQFKECRCGSKILTQWVECGDCVASGISKAGEMRSKHLVRRMEVSRRVSKGEAMRQVLAAANTPEAQGQRILEARRQMRRNVAARVPQALIEWGEG